MCSRWPVPWRIAWQPLFPQQSVLYRYSMTACPCACVSTGGPGHRSWTLMSVCWTFLRSFSGSRGQGWEGRSVSAAGATGDCSTCHRQQHPACSRGDHHLPFAADLLPERGLGEHLPWSEHPRQGPRHRGPGGYLLWALHERDAEMWVNMHVLKLQVHFIVQNLFLMCFYWTVWDKAHLVVLKEAFLSW